jgi:hypothetical protein
MEGEIVFLEYQQAVDFLLPKHYSGRIPSIFMLSDGKLKMS